MRWVLIVVLLLALGVGLYLVLKPKEKSDLQKLCEAAATSGGVDKGACAYADDVGAAANSVITTALKDGSPICGFDSIQEFADDPEAYKEKYKNGCPGTLDPEGFKAGLKRGFAGLAESTGRIGFIGKQQRGTA